MKTKIPTITLKSPTTTYRKNGKRKENKKKKKENKCTTNTDLSSEPQSSIKKIKNEKKMFSIIHVTEFEEP